MTNLVTENGGGTNLSVLVHEYDDFGKTEDGKKMKEAFIERWKKFGLLEGLDGEIKERTAVAYEQVATYLINHYEGNANDEPISTIAFPITRRVICGSIDDRENRVPKERFSFKKFIRTLTDTNTYNTDIDKWVDKFSEFAKKIDKPCDAYAEACVIIAESIVEHMNNDGSDFNEIIENKFKSVEDRWKV